MNPLIFLMLYIILAHNSLNCYVKETTSDNRELIDVVIPCTSKDLPTLTYCIHGIRKYGKNIRRIIVISDKKLTDEAEWFSETNFQFSKLSLANEIFQNEQHASEYIAHKNSRIGWLYQQLLKLYSPLTIPNIASNVLILDSDTIFLKPVSFFDDEGYALYNMGAEYHIPYFEHMKRFLPTLFKVYPEYSGITHHMLFQQHVIKELCEKVEQLHKIELWKVMCRCIDHNHLYNSAFSEYEIYFNFIFDPENKKKVKLRSLNWANTGQINSIDDFQNNCYDYVSCHAYMR